MFAAFWSIVALILTGIIIWLIFASDEKVKRMLKQDDESQAAKAAAAKSAAGASDDSGDPIESPTESMLDALSKPAAATAAGMVAMEHHVEAPMEHAAEQVAVGFTTASDDTDEEVAPAEAPPAEEEASEIEATRSVEVAVDATNKEEEPADVVKQEPSDAVEPEEEPADMVKEVPADDVSVESEEVVDATEDVAVEATVVAGTEDLDFPTTDNYPDRLTKLNGVGEVYERRLYGAGIFTWYQVAETPVAKLSEITQAIDAANVGDWPAQATSLAADAGRSGVRYSGPMPDKLTAIPGIGEAAQLQLRQHGIVTYHQLSIAPTEELEAILGGAGKRADVAAIIAKAKELA